MRIIQKIVNLSIAFSMIVSSGPGFTASGDEPKKSQRGKLAPIGIAQAAMTRPGSNDDLLSPSDPNSPRYWSFHFENLISPNRNSSVKRPQRKLVVNAIEVHLSLSQETPWGDFWRSSLKQSPSVVEIHADRVIVDGAMDFKDSQLKVYAFNIQRRPTGIVYSNHKIGIWALKLAPQPVIVHQLKGNYPQRVKPISGSQKKNPSKVVEETLIDGQINWIQSTDLAGGPLGGTPNSESLGDFDQQFSFANLPIENQIETVRRMMNYLRTIFIIEDFDKTQTEIDSLLPKARILSQSTGVNTTELEILAMQMRLKSHLNFFGHRKSEVPFYTPAFQFQELQSRIDQYLESIEYITALEFQKERGQYHSEFLRRAIDESQADAERAYEDLKHTSMEVLPIEKQLQDIETETKFLSDMVSGDLSYFLKLAKTKRMYAEEDRKRLAMQNKLLGLAVQGAANLVLGPTGVASAQALVHKLKNPPSYDDSPEEQIAWLEGVTADFANVKSGYSNYGGKQSDNTIETQDETSLWETFKNADLELGKLNMQQKLNLLKRGFSNFKIDVSQNLQKSWETLREESHQILNGDVKVDIKQNIKTIGDLRKKIKVLKKQANDQSQALTAAINAHFAQEQKQRGSSSEPSADLCSEDPEVQKYCKEFQESDPTYKRLVSRIETLRSKVPLLTSQIASYRAKAATFESTIETASVMISLTSSELLDSTLSQQTNLTMAANALRNRAEEQLLKDYYRLIHGLRYLFLGKDSAALNQLLAMPLYQEDILKALNKKRASCAAIETNDATMAKCKAEMQQALQAISNQYHLQMGQLKETILNFVTKMDDPGGSLIPVMRVVHRSLTPQELKELGQKGQIDLNLDSHFYGDQCGPKHRMVISGIELHPQKFSTQPTCQINGEENMDFEIELDAEGTMYDEYNQKWSFDYSNLGALNFWRANAHFGNLKPNDFTCSQAEIASRDQAIDLINAIIGNEKLSNLQSANLFNQHAGYTKARLRLPSQKCHHLTHFEIVVKYIYYADAKSEVNCH